MSALWPNNLPAPVFALDNFRIAQAMSARVQKGRVPSFDEAKYAAEQAQDASDYTPVSYADCRG